METILLILFVLIFGRIIFKVVLGISSVIMKIVVVLFSLACTAYIISYLFGWYNIVMMYEDLSEKEQERASENVYTTFRELALELQEKGVKAMKENNALNLKEMTITKDALEVIKIGIPQIINYRGLSFETPFENLSISGFYFLMYIFRFERERQLANFFDDYTVDNILFSHDITGEKLWLKNKVRKISDEEISKFISK